MARSLTARALIAFGLACAGACLVEAPDFTGKACDLPAHACIAGYECVQGICQRPPAVQVSSPASPVLAGSCGTGEVSLWLQDGGPAVSSNSTPVTLEVDGGMRLFADLDCRQEASVVAVPPGGSDASFSFFALRAGRYQIAATASTSRAVLEQDISPIVRTGRCALVDGEDQVSCPVTPPVIDARRAFVVFQASTREVNPGDAGVRCMLAAPDAVSCDRSGDAGQVSVQWQVAEVPGARVQTVTTPSGCLGAGVYVMPLADSVNLSGAFVLMSERHWGATFGMDDFSTARLVTSTAAVVENAAGCSTLGSYALQVIELPGAGVQRGLTGPIDAGVSSVDDLVQGPADPARSLMLHSHRFGGGPGPACSRVLRGESVNGGAAVRFTRGLSPNAPPACVAAGSDVQAVAWEEIQVPPQDSLQRVVLDLASGETEQSVPIAPVDPTRALVLASGQGSAGQAFGETREALVMDQSPAVIQLELDDGGSAVRATRSSSSGLSRWTIYVWEMSPAP